MHRKNFKPLRKQLEKCYVTPEKSDHWGIPVNGIDRHRMRIVDHKDLLLLLYIVQLNIRNNNHLVAIGYCSDSFLHRCFPSIIRARNVYFCCS